METNLKDIIRRTRTCRRFHQDRSISVGVIEEMIDCARLAGSARNLQPLKYAYSNTPEGNDSIFPHLGWAGYLHDWAGPKEGERPAAYIICLLDTTLASEAACDLGIATQNILLRATELDLAGCRIASISPSLAASLGIADPLRIELVIALGSPREQVLLEDMTTTDGDCRYWRDGQQRHHVPKRRLADIIIPMTERK